MRVVVLGRNGAGSRSPIVQNTTGRTHIRTSTKCHINTVVSPDEGYIFAPKHLEIDKYTENKCNKNKLWTKLALFRRLDKTVGVYDTDLDRKG